MKQTSRYILFGVTVIFLGTGAFLRPAFGLGPEDLKNQIDQKTQELAEINAQIETTEKNLDATEAKSKSLNREIQKYDYQIRQINLGIQSSEITIDKLELEVESLAYDIDDKEKEIEVKKNAIVEFLRELQEKDRESTLFILLRNQSLAEGLFETNAIVQLNTSLRSEVTELESVKTLLSDDLDTSTRKKKNVEIESQSLKTKKTISEEQKSGKKTLLSQTKNQEKIYQQQLAELEEKQAEIGSAIDEIEDELRSQFDPSLLPIKRPGVLVNPVLGKIIITQEYGATAYAQKAYSSKFHNGVDYGAPLGTPVVAARDGKVIAVGNNGKFQYGRYIVIQHDNGLSTLYAHLSKQAVVNGASVTTGEVIGYIGNTGYSFGNHLHFVVYWSDSVLMKNLPNCNCGLVPIGVTVDPLDYI